MGKGEQRFFPCCVCEDMGENSNVAGNNKPKGNSIKRSIKKYIYAKSVASFSSISLKSDSSKHRFIADEITKYGNRNLEAQVFSFRELCAATNNFNPRNLLGEGGFGRVYKGNIESLQKQVAVKQLDRNGFQGNKEFLVEVLMLSLLHHPNLVNLVGYCCEGEQRILVYEYMEMGSLESHLLDLRPGQKPLEWNTRIKAAEGAAKGLEYLHEIADPPVIYRDFKASNILLDASFNPKLSDFGLAKLGPMGGQTHVSTRVMGTYGYCAPEYMSTGQLTKKSDVYSFGVVFLELLTGRRVIDSSRPTEEQNLLDWAQPLLKDKNKFNEIADPSMEGHYPEKALYQALAVAAMCLQAEPSIRPFISDVVIALEFLHSSSNTLEGDDDGNEVGEEEDNEDGRTEDEDEVEQVSQDGTEDEDEQVSQDGRREDEDEVEQVSQYGRPKDEDEVEQLSQDGTEDEDEDEDEDEVEQLSQDGTEDEDEDEDEDEVEQVSQDGRTKDEDEVEQVLQDGRTEDEDEVEQVPQDGRLKDEEMEHEEQRNSS